LNSHHHCVLWFSLSAVEGVSVLLFLKPLIAGVLNYQIFFDSSMLLGDNVNAGFDFVEGCGVLLLVGVCLIRDFSLRFATVEMTAAARLEMFGVLAAAPLKRQTLITHCFTVISSEARNPEGLDEVKSR